MKSKMRGRTLPSSWAGGLGDRAVVEAFTEGCRISAVAFRFLPAWGR